jgi:hypothetical protein
LACVSEPKGKTHNPPHKETKVEESIKREGDSDSASRLWHLTLIQGVLKIGLRDSPVRISLNKHHQELQNTLDDGPRLKLPFACIDPALREKKRTK